MKFYKDKNQFCITNLISKLNVPIHKPEKYLLFTEMEPLAIAPDDTLSSLVKPVFIRETIPVIEEILLLSVRTKFASDFTVNISL